MITMTIDIIDVATTEATTGQVNEFGAGVLVKTDGQQLATATNPEGATWVGICTAINDYMRSRGVPNFDCMRRQL